MRISILRESIFASALLALTLGCNRKNYQAHEYHPPLSTPEPVPRGDFSDPASATPERVAPVNQENSDSKGAASNNLPGDYFHCPPPGTTPPSATTVEKGSPLSAIDCPPGDPNASSTRTGLPGTPSAMGSGGEHPSDQGGDNKTNINVHE